MSEQQEPKKINRHLESLRTKARTHTVQPSPSPNRYTVISGGSGAEYTVDVLPGTAGAICTCDWAVKRADKETGEVKPSACSHTIAVFEYVALNRRRVLAVYTTAEKAVKQHQPMVDTQDGVVVTMRKGHYRQTNFLDFIPKVKNVKNGKT